MPISQTKEDQASLEWHDPYDVLIVGSGPVGLSLASEFNDSGIRVAVVESGGLKDDAALVDLDEFENVGASRVLDVRSLRSRGLGGTASIWSGRCAPFNAIDFETRPWVPFSGWPIDASAMGPFIERASRRLGLEVAPYDDSFWSRFGRKPPRGLKSELLQSQFWQYSQDETEKRSFARFGIEFVRRSAANVHVVLDATVKQLRFSPDGSAFTCADIVRSDGSLATVRAKHAVLCAGGIENARLLLNSIKEGQPGRFLARAPIGCFLMDHPRTTIGAFRGRSANVIRSFFGLYRVRAARRTRFFTHGLALSDGVQRAEGLLNCAAWLSEARSQDDPWAALKGLASGKRVRRREISSVVTNLPIVLNGAVQYAMRGRGVLHKCDVVLLDCLVEQKPDPDSRVTLSAQVDRFGVPRARIDWRISQLERETVARFADIIRHEFGRLGLPPPDKVDQVEVAQSLDFRDVAHPIGTTRMARDERLGVVDENCQVHGVGGLYVAGSSVFPTSGHANPTLMAVALAIRLGDHLKRVIGQA